MKNPRTPVYEVFVQIDRSTGKATATVHLANKVIKTSNNKRYAYSTRDREVVTDNGYDFIVVSMLSC